MMWLLCRRLAAFAGDMKTSLQINNANLIPSFLQFFRREDEEEENKNV